MQLRGFLMAVDDCSPEAIEDAARRFVSGQAQDHDGRFSPSSAQFAKEARYRQEIMDLKRAAANRPKLPAPEPDLSPRIGAEKMADLSRALSTGDFSHLSKYARTEH